MATGRSCSCARCCEKALPKSPTASGRRACWKKNSTRSTWKSALREFDIDKVPEVIRDVIPELGLNPDCDSRAKFNKLKARRCSTLKLDNLEPGITQAE